MKENILLSVYPSIDAERTGMKLKLLCELRNVSPRELQDYLKLGSVQAVYHWFRGIRVPSIDNLYAISKYLDVKIDDLIIGSLEPGGSCIQESQTASADRSSSYWVELCSKQK